MQRDCMIQRVVEFLLVLREAVLTLCPLPFVRAESRFDFTLLKFQTVKLQPINLSLKTLSLVARLTTLLAQVRCLLLNSQIATKRSLYYKYLKYYKDNYDLLDTDLKLLARSLGVRRRDLNIVASSKCIINGFLMLNQSGKQLEITRDHNFYLTNTDTFEISELYSRVVVVVEKESVFNYLASRVTSKGYLLVTSKGYPDYITQQFLCRLLGFTELFYYVGDIDPYGFDIMLQYTIGDSFQGFGVLKMEWINLEGLIQLDCVDLDTLWQQYMDFSQQDHNKINLILCKDYLGGVNQSPNNQSVQSAAMVSKFQRWKQRIIKSKTLQKKVEVESFLKCLTTSPDLDILDILIQNGFIV